MDITIETSDSWSKPEVVIRCGSVDAEIERLIARIQSIERPICGKKGNEVFVLNHDDIIYFDTADERVFAYTANGVYETDLKLYEIERRFDGTSVMRVSKSAIVNILKIEHLTPLINGRILATLQTKAKVVISRQYVAAFKRKLGL